MKVGGIALVIITILLFFSYIILARYFIYRGAVVVLLDRLLCSDEEIALFHYPCHLYDLFILHN